MPNSIFSDGLEKQSISVVRKAPKESPCKTNLCAVGLAVSLALFVSSQTQTVAPHPAACLKVLLVSAETKKKLLQIEKQRKELHEQAALPGKEQLAMVKIIGHHKKTQYSNGSVG